MLEIERKFLPVKGFSISDLGDLRVTNIYQTYFKTQDDKSLRVRETAKEVRLTMKGKPLHGGLACEELETVIDRALMVGMLKHGTVLGSVSKIRYYYEYKGFTYEIDRYFGKNEGLVTIEVEMPTVDTVVELPPFIGEEVTLDKRYKNKKLAINPFTTWKKS